jgi:hypothetical protein
MPLVAVVVLILCGCAAKAGPKPALGATFILRYGERATISTERLSLTFQKVLEESRCPAGVTCIWEGNARIVLKAERPPAAASMLELNTSGRYPAEAAYEGYTVRLRGVRPAPEHGRELDAAEYSAEIEVTRAGHGD